MAANYMGCIVPLSTSAVKGIPDESLADFVKDQRAEAAEVGLRLLEYGYCDRPDIGGVHIFVYITVLECRETEELLVKRRAFLTAADDDQPCSTYTQMSSAIWHFVPFYA